MRDFSSAYRRALTNGDVSELMRLFALLPHLPQPESYEQAEISMHIARTMAESIDVARRLYSHKWLCERNLPSQLPDHLRPKQQRLGGIVVQGVGISVNTSNPLRRREADDMRHEMELAVLDLYANNDTEPEVVRRRLDDIRRNRLRM